MGSRELESLDCMNYYQEVEYDRLNASLTKSWDTDLYAIRQYVPLSRRRFQFLVTQPFLSRIFCVYNREKSHIEIFQSSFSSTFIEYLTLTSQYFISSSNYQVTSAAMDPNTSTTSEIDPKILQEVCSFFILGYLDPIAKLNTHRKNDLDIPIFDILLYWHPLLALRTRLVCLWLRILQPYTDIWYHTGFEKPANWETSVCDYGKKDWHRRMCLLAKSLAGVHLLCGTWLKRGSWTFTYLLSLRILSWEHEVSIFNKYIT